MSIAASEQSMPYPTKEELENRYSSESKTSSLKSSSNNKNKTPPYDGTVFIDKNMVTDLDPSSFRGGVGDLVYAGKKCRVLWDHGWKTHPDTHVFKVSFSDGVKTEMWVVPEIGRKRAKKMVRETAFHLGQVPQFLRRGMRVVMIAKGEGGFGGNPDGHVNFYDQDFTEFKRNGFMTEVLIHEGGHATLDKTFYGWKKWKLAVQKDGGFVSDYAEDNPNREDVAETVSTWVGTKLKLLNKAQRDKIKKQIPYRLKAFNSQNYNLFPLDGSAAKPIKDYECRPLADWYYCDDDNNHYDYRGSDSANGDNYDGYDEFGKSDSLVKFAKLTLNTTKSF